MPDYWFDDDALVEDLRYDDMNPPKEEPDCGDCCDSGRSCKSCHPNRWQLFAWSARWRIAALVARLIPNRAVRYNEDEAPF